MNKKVSTIIIVSICAIFIVVLAVGYMCKEGIIDTSNIFSGSNDVTEENNSQSESKEDMPHSAYFKVGAETTLHLEENVDTYIKYNSMNITKKIGDFDKCTYQGDEKTDENGTITNDYSYVVCNITVKNIGTEDFLTTVNNLLLFENGRNSAYDEVRAYNSHLKNTVRKDYYYANLKPNEEHNYNVVYVVKDDIIKKYKDNFLIYVLFSGPQVNPSDPIIEKK